MPGACEQAKYPPLGAAAAAFATINILRQNGLIYAAVATDRTPETPSSACAACGRASAAPEVAAYFRGGRGRCRPHARTVARGWTRRWPIAALATGRRRASPLRRAAGRNAPSGIARLP